MFPVGSFLVDGGSQGDSDGGLDGGSQGESDGGPNGARSSSFSLSKYLSDFRPEDHLRTKEPLFGNSFTAGDFVSLGGGHEALRLAFHRG